MVSKYGKFNNDKTEYTFSRGDLTNQEAYALKGLRVSLHGTWFKVLKVTLSKTEITFKIERA